MIERKSIDAFMDNYYGTNKPPILRIS